MRLQIAMKLPIADWRLPIFSKGPHGRRFSIGNSAFTLIEVMVVVAIIGLLAAMGMPSLMKAVQKEGMRKAVDDMTGVFFSARERAIITNQKVAVVFHPRERKFEVEGTAGGEGTIVNSHSGRALMSTLPDGVQMPMLDIFRQDYGGSDWAKIFFNPDGTCDEAVIILTAKGGAESQKITLEYATGLPDVTPVDR